MSTRGVRRLPLRRLPARLGRGARAHAAIRRPVRRRGGGADRRRGDRPPALDRGQSMLVDAGGANIPGGEFFGCPVEDSAEGVDRVHRVPGRLQRSRAQGHPASLRGRPRGRRVGGDERGLPARDARHRRRRAPARRARHRLQPRDHALHAEHAVRREDRRHRPRRARQRLARPRREQRLAHPLGHRQGPPRCPGRGSSSTARSSSATAPG